VSRRFAESTVEESALSWFKGLGYSIFYGPDMAPEEPAAERAAFDDLDQG